MSSSGHIDNKKKDILVLAKGPTKRLEHTLKQRIHVGMDEMYEKFKNLLMLL